jgi:3-phenylpropionate/trans-cinnamate dioxygenase ferredoxin reductase component
MVSSQKLVVVGGGQAAGQLIDEARYRGYSGKITLISDESVLPYQRPPLSKQYLKGTHDQSWLYYRPADFYPSNNVDVMLNRTVTAIDRNNKIVTLDDNSPIEYDKLALTVGARARQLTIPGAHSKLLCYIRTLQDVNSFKSKLRHSKRVIIIGGGFIGLEAAAILKKMGRAVHLLASESVILPRLGDPTLSRYLKQKHLAEGVDITCNVKVARIEEPRNGSVSVLGEDGKRFHADLVLAGIGAIPNTELAEQAGLRCHNGIVVNEYCQTSDPNIYAAGDCTNHPNPFSSTSVRLETVHNAVEQGRTAGASIAGKQIPYRQIPWVWSDQYDIRLQSVGFINEADESITFTSEKGRSQDERFSVLYFSGQKLVAANCINQPRIFAAARRIMNSNTVLTASQARSPNFDLTVLSTSRPQFELEAPVR